MTEHRTKIALVFGSGMTVGAYCRIKYNQLDYDVPMDNNFFRTLLVQTLFDKNKYPALHYYQRQFNCDSMETTVSAIDLISKLCMSGIMSEDRAYGELSDSLHAKAEMNNSYKNKLALEKINNSNTVPSMANWEFMSLLLDIYSKLEMPEESPLKKLLGVLHNKELIHSITTFNYDLAVEKAFDDYYYPLLTKKQKSSIPLFKLHGSLNWQERSRIGEYSITRLGSEEYAVWEFNVDGDYCQPSMVLPTLFKQEVNIDFQKDIRAIFYKKLWASCWKALSCGEVTALIFVGFSFPETDTHARVFFQNIKRTNPKLKKIIFCVKEDEAAEERARRIFGGDGFHAEQSGFESLVNNIDQIIRLIEAA